MKYSSKLSSIIALIFALSVLAQTTFASGFAAPVQVANTEASPVPVRDVSNALHQHIQLTLSAAKGDDFIVYYVPSGKRLHIEQISANFRVLNGPGSLYMQAFATLVGADSYTGQDTPSWFYFTPTPVYDGSTFVLDSRKVDIVASSGGKTAFSFSANGGTVEYYEVTFSGYLEAVN